MMARASEPRRYVPAQTESASEREWDCDLTE